MDEALLIPCNWDVKLGNIIKVIGVGGGGNNAVKNMYVKGITGVDFIICNTDAQVLDQSPVPVKIQLGQQLTEGLGTGCDPDKGRDAALENIEEIKEILSQNTKMVFIAAGLGGGTGTGAAPIIAKEAKAMGILTVAIVTLPFKDEGEEPYERAMKGLSQLRQNVDSLLIINNQRLYDIYSDLSVFEAFVKADDIVTTAAKSTAELITVKGEINVDMNDVRMVMKDGGMALMGLGRAAGENRWQTAVDQALKSPLLNNNDISDAKKVLVNISSGMKKPLKMEEMGKIMNYLNEMSGGNANFKRGVSKDSSLDDESSDAEIGIIIIATGFSMDSSFPDAETPPDDRVTVVPLTDNMTDINDEIHLQPEQSEITVKTVVPQAPAPSVKKPVQNTGTPKEISLADMEKIPAYERANTKIVIETSTVGNVAIHRLDDSPYSDEDAD
jgi:cell division protein FtsZ